MNLNEFSLKDKKVFSRYINSDYHELSVYSFQNIYIWKGLFNIKWAIIRDNLCVFFQDKIGTFLYLAPLGNKNANLIQEIFHILDAFNKNKAISHIENIEEKDLAFYQGLGFISQKKYDEYVCLRDELVDLPGNKFKSKRSSIHYFVKNHEFEYLPYSLRYRRDCLRLYDRWMAERKTQHNDALYQNMLQDNRASLKVALDNFSKLKLTGRVVKINKEIMAFTFGFKLNADTFCVLYEITDLSIKGLAQFIFHKFCSELKEYKYINIMDDSGLENLKKVKLSYHPIRLHPSYIVSRKEYPSAG
jgi:hypothetical protein